MPFPIPESLYSPLVKLLFEKLPGWIDPIIKRSAVVVAVAVILLGGSVYFFYRYLSESRQMEDAMIGTVRADLEPTPQRFKGLEAFILSHVDIAKTQQLIESSTLADGFRGKYIQFLNDARAAAEAASAGAASKHAPYLQGERASQAGCSAADIGSLLVISTPSGDPIVTDQGCNGFLFVPLELVRGSAQVKSTSNADVTELVKSDEYLRKDILVTRGVATSLTTFLKPLIDAKNNKAKADEAPAQVYLISKSGLPAGRIS